MSDEDESLLDSDEEESPKPRRENSTIKQMRETLEARETALKAAEERAAKYEQTFLKSSGLTDKQSAALRAAGYEASPEGIDAFRSEVLEVVQEEATTEQSNEDEEEVDETTAEPEAAFAPTITGGTTPAGKREVTSNELLALMKTDPVKADKLLRSGRVVRKEFNPGGPAW